MSEVQPILQTSYYFKNEANNNNPTLQVDIPVPVIFYENITGVDNGFGTVILPTVNETKIGIVILVIGYNDYVYVNPLDKYTIDVYNPNSIEKPSAHLCRLLEYDKETGIGKWQDTVLL